MGGGRELMQKLQSCVSKFGKKKNYMIEDVGSWHNGVWRWNLQWKRHWFDWEQEVVCHMWNAIECHGPKLTALDGWDWSTNSGKVYNMLNIGDTMVGADFFQLWKLPIPSKVKGFIWRMAHDKLQTMDNLHKRNIITNVIDMKCVLCREQVETSRH